MDKVINAIKRVNKVYLIGAVCAVALLLAGLWAFTLGWAFMCGVCLGLSVAIVTIAYNEGSRR